MVSPNGDLTYTPLANAHGASTITLNVTDNGGILNGGSSTGPTRTFSITVSPVNDAPVLDSSGSSAVADIDEDATGNNGVTIAELLATGAGGDPVSDVDDHALEGIGSGIAVIGVDGDGHGEWQYSTNAGASWTAFGSPSAAAARLLAAAARVRFVPSANWNGSIAQGLTFRAWDLAPGSGSSGGTANITAVGIGYATAFSASYEIAALTVNPVNDAPILDNSGSMTLETILEDQEINTGTSVAALIASAGGNRITEVSYEISPVEGIAITAADSSHGAWQYSLDNGGAWSDLGEVSDTNARLLVSDTQTKLRFLPGADWSLLWGGAATPTITFRAWDQISGSSGSLASASPNGGTSAFSTASETAAITITGRNDAPTFTKGADITIDEGAPAQEFSAWATAISPGPADEVAQGQATAFHMVYNTAPELFSEQPSLGVDGTLTFTPESEAYGEATIIFELQDDGGTLSQGVDTSPLHFFVITLLDVNDQPSFTKGADQSAAEDSGAQTVSGWATAIRRGPANEDWQDLTFFVSGNTHPELFSAGPSIDADGTLRYTPAANANGSADLTIYLHDGGGTLNGGTADSAAQTFTITISPANDAPVNTSLPRINGQPYVQEILSATSGSWNDNLDITPGTISYTYQWQRASDSAGNGLVDLPGATSATYIVDLLDSNQFLRVRVTATDNGEGLPASQATIAASDYVEVEGVNLNASVTAFSANTPEDTLLAFTAQDFTTHFSQVADLPLERVRITVLPQHGALFMDNNDNGLEDSGEGVILGLEILAEDLGSLAFLPAADWYGADGFSWNATEDIGHGYPLPGPGVEAAITVSAVNDAPGLSALASISTHEDTPSLPFGIDLADVDVDLADPSADDYLVSLDCSFGSLALGGTTGLTFVEGADHSCGLVIQGTLTDLQTALDGLVYSPQPGFTGQDVLEMVINDQGNTGAGGALSDTLSLTIYITNVNNAPVNILPAGFIIDANHDSEPLDFEFTDDPGLYMQVTFSAAHGSLTLADPHALTLVAGSNSSHFLTYRGPVLKMIRAVLDVIYSPDADYAGPDTITFTTNDLGGTGTGSALSDTDTLDLIVNGAPVAEDDLYYMSAEGTFSQSAPGVLANDTDINLDPLLASLIDSPDVGSLTLQPDGAFTYTPPQDYTGSVSFTYQVSDGRLDSTPATVTIVVEKDLEVELDYQSNGSEITYTLTAHNPNQQRKFTNPQFSFTFLDEIEMLSVTHGTYDALNRVVESELLAEINPGETLTMSWTVRPLKGGSIRGRWNYSNDSTHGSGEFTIYRLCIPIVMNQ